MFVIRQTACYFVSIARYQLFFMQDNGHNYNSLDIARGKEYSREKPRGVKNIHLGNDGMCERCIFFLHNLKKRSRSELVKNIGMNLRENATESPREYVYTLSWIVYRAIRLVIQAHLPNPRH